jgi:hypothetical protein
MKKTLGLLAYMAFMLFLGTLVAHFYPYNLFWVYGQEESSTMLAKLKHFGAMPIFFTTLFVLFHKHSSRRR